MMREAEVTDTGRESSEDSKPLALKTEAAALSQVASRSREKTRQIQSQSLQELELQKPWFLVLTSRTRSHILLCSWKC